MPSVNKLPTSGWTAAAMVFIAMAAVTAAFWIGSMQGSRQAASEHPGDAYSTAEGHANHGGSNSRTQGLPSAFMSPDQPHLPTTVTAAGVPAVLNQAPPAIAPNTAQSIVPKRSPQVVSQADINRLTATAQKVQVLQEETTETPADMGSAEADIQKILTEWNQPIPDDRRIDLLAAASETDDEPAFRQLLESALKPAMGAEVRMQAVFLASEYLPQKLDELAKSDPDEEVRALALSLKLQPHPGALAPVPDPNLVRQGQPRTGSEQPIPSQAGQNGRVQVGD